MLETVLERTENIVVFELPDAHCPLKEQYLHLTGTHLDGEAVLVGPKQTLLPQYSPSGNGANWYYFVVFFAPTADLDCFEYWAGAFLYEVYISAELALLCEDITLLEGLWDEVLDELNLFVFLSDVFDDWHNGGEEFSSQGEFLIVELLDVIELLLMKHNKLAILNSQNRSISWFSTQQSELPKHITLVNHSDGLPINFRYPAGFLIQVPKKGSRLVDFDFSLFLVYSFILSLGNRIGHAK